MNTFTLEFDYNGTTYQYVDIAYNAINDESTYEFIAYNLVEGIVNNADYKKEGITATNIKLTNKKDEILFISKHYCPQKSGRLKIK